MQVLAVLCFAKRPVSHLWFGNRNFSLIGWFSPFCENKRFRRQNIFLYRASLSFEIFKIALAHSKENG